MAGGAKRFRASDFVIRFLFAYALILATWNPTGYSYVHWLLEPDYTYLPVKLFIGLTLFLLHAFVGRIALRALGRRGLVLAALFFGSAGWALWSQDLLPDTVAILVMMMQAALATGIAAGLSVVIVWQQASGQVTAADEMH